MKVVAFLQNMWVRDPVRTKRCFDKHGEEFRLKFMHYALFAGCLTGRRLKAAFGMETCRQIVWEETTREIAGDAKTIFPADLGHMRWAIEQHKATTVIVFGRIAEDAIRKIAYNGTTIIAPHPAGRSLDTIERLKAAAQALKDIKANENLLHH